MATNSSNNARFTDPIKDAAQKEAQAIIINMLHQISLKISEYVKEYIDEVYKSSKQRRLKFKEILNVISNSNSSYKEIQTAVQEANNITKLIKNETDHLNLFELVRKPVLSSRYNKWKRLRDTAIEVLLSRLVEKAKQSATTKKETEFFSDYPQLQSEIIKVNSPEAIESLNSDIKSEIEDGNNKDS